ncbi:hypothetical protein C1H46_001707 [Malus baccata]|uniref:Uncharacterized protein n=1 Tax=Malus baccata TaxID=106549 RepID=A0A540NNS2_MALBA|nr:hypothetical protein C1H46_001707 [Malus baccata]
MLYHFSEEFGEEPLPPEWYQKAFPKLTKLTQSLKNVNLIDGRLVNISDGSIIIDDRVEQRMLTFKSPATVFIGVGITLVISMHTSSHDSSSWTRLAPAIVIDSSGLQKWEEVLDMFNDLIDWLKNERELLVSVAKLEVMKERLSQEDVLTEAVSRGCTR